MILYFGYNMAIPSEKTFSAASNEIPTYKGYPLLQSNKPQLSERLKNICLDFTKSFGLTFSAALAILPPALLMLRSKDMKEIAKIGAGGIAITAILQLAWAYFEKSDKAKSNYEEIYLAEIKKNCEETDQFQEAHFLEIETGFTEATSPETSFCESNNLESDEFINSILSPTYNLESIVHYFESMTTDEEKRKLFGKDYSEVTYTEKYDTIKAYFNALSQDFKKSLWTQFASDRVVIELNEFKKAIKKSKTNVENSENLVSVVKSYSLVFKTMSIFAKVFKGVGDVGTRYNLWNGIKQRDLYKKYSDPISLTKSIININVCIAEFFCLSERKKEIIALQEQIDFLKSNQEKVQVLLSKACTQEKDQDCIDQLESTMTAINHSLERLETKKSELIDKNKNKSYEIIYNLVGESLSGFKDLIELIHTYTQELKDNQKLFETVVRFQEFVIPILSYLSLALNLRKLYNQGKNVVQLHFYQNSLENFKLYNYETEDISFEQFLDLKIDVIRTQKITKLWSCADKTFKVASDILSIIKWTHLPAFAAASIGFAVVRFCLTNIYQERHNIVYKVKLVWLRCERGSKYRALSKFIPRYMNTCSNLRDTKALIKTQGTALNELLVKAKNDLLIMEDEIAALKLSLEENNGDNNLLGIIQDKENHLKDCQEKLERHTQSPSENNIDFFINPEDAEIYKAIQKCQAENTAMLEDAILNYNYDKEIFEDLRHQYESVKNKVKKAKSELVNRSIETKVSNHTSEKVNDLKDKLCIELQDPKKKATWARKLQELGLLKNSEISVDIVMKHALSKNIPNAAAAIAA